jgi:hypothetical protein
MFHLALEMEQRRQWKRSVSKSHRILILQDEPHKRKQDRIGDAHKSHFTDGAAPAVAAVLEIRKTAAGQS